MSSNPAMPNIVLVSKLRLGHALVGEATLRQPPPENCADEAEAPGTSALQSWSFVTRAKNFRLLKAGGLSEISRWCKPPGLFQKCVKPRRGGGQLRHHIFPSPLPGLIHAVTLSGGSAALHHRLISSVPSGLYCATFRMAVFSRSLLLGNWNGKNTAFLHISQHSQSKTGLREAFRHVRGSSPDFLPCFPDVRNCHWKFRVAFPDMQKWSPEFPDAVRNVRNRAGNLPD
jgi:hypothetical protein